MQVNKKSIVIVIPVYKSSINTNERICLEQALKILSGYTISFMVPENLSFQPSQLIPGNATLEKVQLVKFADKWFSSTREYSKLLVTREFYQAFDQYDFMLLYQLDAYVFYDSLQEWASKGFDYIGAPWTKEHEQWFFESMYRGKFKIILPFMRFINKVFFGKKDYAIGNGGLSLRNIKKSLKILRIFSFIAKRWTINEDIFWCMAVPILYPFFKVPNKIEAFNFSFECNCQELFEMNENKLPFGCHAWEKYEPEFWKRFIK